VLLVLPVPAVPLVLEQVGCFASVMELADCFALAMEQAGCFAQVLEQVGCFALVMELALVPQVAGSSLVSPLKMDWVEEPTQVWAMKVERCSLQSPRSWRGRAQWH
jgi:hypothetical protein